MFKFLLPFILVFLSILLLTAARADNDKTPLKALGCIWIGVLVLGAVSVISQWLMAKKELSKKDYYGSYIIDRSYFAGKQANWQYNSFRFEIKNNDSLYFHVTNGEKILKTYLGSISTVKPYNSERLILHIDQPSHHIIFDNPTIHRSAWGFYLVFYSLKFNNVYFKKGDWEPIKQ